MTSRKGTADPGRVKRIAIVGGGPGGLMSARLIEELKSNQIEVTLFEQSRRLGGKVRTDTFSTVPARFEAGAAEIYDYSHLGIDPLKELIVDLGLDIAAMRGSAILLDGHVVRGDADIIDRYGWPTFRAIGAFRSLCSSLYSPSDYYESYTKVDAVHPWAKVRFDQILSDIADPVARKYIETAVRSDTATEPARTSALNGLKNVLMDDPRYMRLYTIRNGNERLTEALARNLTRTRIRMSARVNAVRREPSGRGCLLSIDEGGERREEAFDVVILAMPHNQLRLLSWGDEALAKMMTRFIAHYDHPAHYLRVTAVFKRPFWRRHWKGNYAISDAFGGCCIYDESSRFPCGSHGVLSWLIAGEDAKRLSAREDRDIVDAALLTLAGTASQTGSGIIEAQVDRWIDTVSALPGGWQLQSLRERHQPAARTHPGLFVVGDYLFDSTLNAAYDSADCVCGLVVDLLRRSDVALARARSRRHTRTPRRKSADGVLDPSYFDFYAGADDYQESIGEFFSESYVIGLIKTIWGCSPPYRLLDCGSANGLTLARFARRKVDAWGVENSPYIHARTPPRWLERNLLGDVRNLPYPDGHFDFVYETCLCYVPRKDIKRALRELFRVTRKGVLFGSIATDMNQEVVQAYDLLQYVRTPLTLMEWSEAFADVGFRLATADPRKLDRAWRLELRENAGAAPWYADAESLRYCFYSKDPQAQDLLLHVADESLGDGTRP